MSVSVQCSNCGASYNSNVTNWLCPECHWKDSCCEGAPQRVDKADAVRGTGCATVWDLAHTRSLR